MPSRHSYISITYIYLDVRCGCELHFRRQKKCRATKISAVFAERVNERLSNYMHREKATGYKLNTSIK